MNKNENDHVENPEDTDLSNTAAIIGMAGRFPGAENIDQFWRNLVQGVECISFYEEQELIDAGIDPEAVKNPDYVKAKGEVGKIDVFDADFFGINPREAEVTDPQHRMLLECAWEAMEHAGYDSSKYDGPIGVYAGKSMDYYLLLNVFPHIKKEISSGSLQAAIGNDKDSLTTLISYRLNLTGPAVTIQTSSSTSLVAVCAACQNLLTYQCDIALAGGITAGPPIKSGYLYQKGGIWSPDGHCRAFDADAKGFVPGSGMGLVVLKRLEDALMDGDHIRAVIKGFAVNNDGYNKVSYTAPSVDAQAEVVAAAQAAADVHPETVTYIEAHGTGTNLGDPIEMTALTQAFRVRTDKKQFCAIGSVKTNIGHLDNASGIAGLIKTALALEHKMIPASLYFETPNPKIDFENSPFYVNTRLKEWKAGQTPRRGGVTSLGMGGTNAHVILEEAPQPVIGHSSLVGGETGKEREYQLIPLSAKTDTALDKMTENLVNYLKENPGHCLADIAYTLSMGRRDFDHRRVCLCRDIEEAVDVLDHLTPGVVFHSVCENTDRPVVFMFSGQGAQYVNMGKELYQKEPVFKENFDTCAEFLVPVLGMDIREAVYPVQEGEGEADRYAGQLGQTWLTQPVLFTIEYSLARLWMHWGIVPIGMIGHSIGEFTAACIAGCMSLEDALKLVAVRGRLMQNQDEGAMLSVGVNRAEIAGMLTDDISLAAVNSPKHCVVSGKTRAVKHLEEQLSRRSLFCRRLKTSHAFHSPMMEPIMNEFAGVVSKVKLNTPKIPFISGVTGTWIRDDEACTPRYWAEQLRKPVRFSDGIREILKTPDRILLEVGPGNNLCVLAKEHKDNNEPKAGIFSSIRHIKQTEPDMAFLLKTFGNLWLSGITIDWGNYYKNEKRHRIPLPTYPFERKRYWLEGVKEGIPHTETGMEKETAAAEESISPGAAAPGEKQVKTEEIKSFQPRPKLNSEYVKPTTEIEQLIVDIWEDILGIKPIGKDDNFFDLGGHSLLASLFLSRLQEEYGFSPDLNTIFEEPTVASFARLVETEMKKSGDTGKIEDILQEVEGLSQDDIREALPD
jgi:acyl transferase domain-containing protein/acyl carrier protein